MKLSVGFSPCPNDTFIMDALVHSKIDTDGMSFTPHLEDVETLNHWAMEGRLDITKLSFHAYLKVKNQYALLDAGAALGYGCGPLLIARRDLSDDDIAKGPIAIPGELTTAHMLFTLRYPLATHKEFMVFSDIETAVLEGKVVAGVIIHENRFTYAQKGLVSIVDLGEYWEGQTGHAIPLGAIVAHRRLDNVLIQRFDNILHNSVQYAFDHPTASRAYVQAHAQEMATTVQEQHIRTYVNEFSLSLGSTGHAAIAKLESEAIRAGLIA